MDLRGAGKNVIEPSNNFIEFLAPFLNFGTPSKKPARGPWPRCPTSQGATEELSNDIQPY